MLFLNPFALITKSDNEYKFIQFGKTNYISIKSDADKSDLLNRLINGESISYNILIADYGKEVVDELINNKILTYDKIDNKSMMSRTKAFIDMYFEQKIDSLCEKKVLIIGCGGIGTHLAWHMAVMGIGHITLVDFDKVEESNLNRQILFDLNDVGKYKVDVLKKKLHDINPYICINAIRFMINSENDIESLCNDIHYDLIIKSADMPEKLPVYVDNICKKLKIPYITGITMQRSALVGPTYIPGKYEIGWQDLMKNIDNNKKVHGIMPSMSILLYHIADELAIESFKILANYGELKYAEKVVVSDIFSNSTTIIENNSNSKTTTKNRIKCKIVANFAAIFLLILMSFWNTKLLIPTFLISIVLPFFIVENRINILRCTLINSSIFSLLSFAVILRSGIFDIIGSIPEKATSAILLLGILCVIALLSMFINFIICKILKK